MDLAILEIPLAAVPVGNLPTFARLSYFRKMKYTAQKPDGKYQVLIAPTFVDALAGRSILTLPSFTDVFEDAQNLINHERRVDPNAFNRARGAWYEWLIAAGVAEYDYIHNPNSVMLQLPNVSGFDCSRLYRPEISGYIDDLRLKVKATNGVSLITSNPDFVILTKISNFKYPSLDRGVTVEFIEKLSASYLHFVGQCDLDEIRGYVAAKLSLRPDRRLQIPHEGSLMKALYRHIQTRQWNINAPGVKYYAIMASYNDSDENALNTVATHSIVDVSSEPQSAVDGLAAINSGQELKDFLDLALT